MYSFFIFPQILQILESIRTIYAIYDIYNINIYRIIRVSPPKKKNVKTGGTSATILWWILSTAHVIDIPNQSNNISPNGMIFHLPCTEHLPPHPAALTVSGGWWGGYTTHQNLDFPEITSPILLPKTLPLAWRDPSGATDISMLSTCKSHRDQVTRRHIFFDQQEKTSDLADFLRIFAKVEMEILRDSCWDL